jgi:hypothetical protein
MTDKATTPKKPKRRFMLLDGNGEPTGTVFRASQPRGAALKAANRGVTQITLFDRVNSIHRFTGSRTLKPRGHRPPWASELDLYRVSVKKLSNEVLGEEDAGALIDKCKACDDERSERRQRSKEQWPETSNADSLARLLKAVGEVPAGRSDSALLTQLGSGKGTTADSPLTDITVPALYQLICGVLGWTVAGNQLSRTTPEASIDTLYLCPPGASTPEVLLYVLVVFAELDQR